MTSPNDTVWAEILSYVQNHYPAVNREWFSQIKSGELDQGRLTVIARDPAQVVYLQRHCVRPFVEAAQFATGRLVSVEFANGKNGSAVPVVESRNDRDDVPSFERDMSLLRLTPDCTFDHFVMGPCNRFAHAAALAVSDAPGTAYNPLFIYGACGLGKTHLLQAICHKVLDQSPATRIMYVSCETFVNHFIEAVERGALNGFRDLYRRVDLLVIDDVQFLAGRDQTQEEFFHTFNTLYQFNKQIILSADAPPPQIPTLEERLISRFNWGLITRIDPPCLETRCAIIQKKMRLKRIELPEEVIMLIAERVESNTRELEGAINRIQGRAVLEGRAVDLALAREALGDEPQLPVRQVKIQDIMKIVTDRFDVKLSDLQGRKRSRSIALPRQVCMFFARQLTQHSLEEIGGFFGGRDHTTVLHANKLIADRRQNDMTFRSRLDEIETSLLKSN